MNKYGIWDQSHADGMQNWISEPAYVNYNGRSYSCTDDHVSDSANEPGKGDNWEDYWLRWSFYVNGSRVNYEGKTYECIIDHKSNASTDAPGTSGGDNFWTNVNYDAKYANWRDGRNYYNVSYYASFWETGTSYKEQYYILLQTKRTLIENNVMADAHEFMMSRNGIGREKVGPGYVSPQYEDWVIRNNVFYGMSNFFGQFEYINGLEFYHNTFIGREQNGTYRPNYGLYLLGCNDLKMYNNIFVYTNRPSNWGTCYANKIGAVQFTGNGLNDMESGGEFAVLGYRQWANQYRVQIKSTGTPDTFRWYRDGGMTWQEENVAITGEDQYLESWNDGYGNYNGITVRFSATTGHSLDDRWDFNATKDIGHNIIYLYGKTLFTPIFEGEINPETDIVIRYIPDGLDNWNDWIKFADPDIRDYMLDTGSPAIDKGINLTEIVDSDKSGTPRPQDGDGNGTAEWDIGAYEYTP